MSYDLAVWVGPRPASNDAALAEYERRMDAMEAALEGEDLPVDPAIREFVEAALERYPELDEGSGDESPWSSSPLLDDAVGDLLYFGMTFSGAAYARDVLADLASSLDLVCFDPQIEQLLPDPTATPAEVIGEQAYAALEEYLQRERPRSWVQRLFRR